MHFSHRPSHIYMQLALGTLLCFNAIGRTQLTSNVSIVCEVLWWVCLFVCFVCLSVCLHNWKTTWLNFTKFFIHVACGGSSVLLWQHCNTLCTSGFTDWHHVFIPWDQWADGHGVVWFAVWRYQWVWLLTGCRLLWPTGSLVWWAGLLGRPEACQPGQVRWSRRRLSSGWTAAGECGARYAV